MEPMVAMVLQNNRDSELIDKLGENTKGHATRHKGGLAIDRATLKTVLVWLFG